MRNFLRIASGVDIQPLLLSLYRQQHLWNALPFRTAFDGSPHREAADILLRLQALDGSSTDKRECIDYQAFAAFPQARRFVYALMAQVEGERLGRVMFTRLPPRGQIYPHEDIGPTALHYDHEPYYSRFHLVLQADEKSIFQCEQEYCNMLPGDIYWFDNSKTHAVYNDGQIDRIHLIMDLKCSTYVPR